MKKTLYSLMLSEEVVREVDRMAHRLGTNRSSLVNRILAEHLSVRTPEEEIRELFSALEERLLPSEELIPVFDPTTLTLSLRSCLSYKYRPTLRYEVTVDHESAESGGQFGLLSLSFRTQSAALLAAMTSFFTLWQQIERERLSPLLGQYPGYVWNDGRFVRTILYPHTRGGAKEISSGEFAEALSSYIRLFDRLMKAYICSDASGTAIEAAYAADLSARNILF